MSSPRFEIVALAGVGVLIAVLVALDALRGTDGTSGAPAPPADGSPNDGPPVLSATTRQLHAMLRDCDRIRVLPSTAYLEAAAAHAQALFEVEGVDAVAAVAASIRIVDDGGGGLCACHGHAVIEFRRANAPVAAFSLHHGRALRWAYGEQPRGWLSDARLVPESQVALCRWLAQHGQPGPLEELTEHGRGLEILDLRESRYRAILPEEVWKGWTDHQALGRRLEQAVHDPLERLLLVLRLYGSHPGTWSQYAGWDTTLRDLLEAAPSPDVAQALRTPSVDPDLLDGLARALFNDRDLGDLNAAIEASLDRVGRAGVTHPDRENRRRSMAAIARMGALPGVLGLLRAILSGDLEARTLEARWQGGNPGGYVSYRGFAAEVREPESDRVAAAWLLATLGDRESLEGIRALRAWAQVPEDAAVLTKALDLLE